MSYQNQSLLETDPGFQRRVGACNTEQGSYFINAAAADMKALAGAVLRGDPGPMTTLLRLAAGAPGLVDKATTPDGGIDQSRISDADLLSVTQANWPTVAALYYTPEGSPI